MVMVIDPGNKVRKIKNKPLKKEIKSMVKEAKLDSKINKRYGIVDKKIKSAYSKSEKKGVKAEKKYGYNYQEAIKSGATPDETGHWPSINPDNGKILKGRKHPSMVRTKSAEKSLGNKIKKIKGELYSVPKKNK